MSGHLSTFERVRESCLTSGRLWEDPEFPAEQSSVFYHQTPPFAFSWRRPPEIDTAPLFFSDGAPFDVVPGKLGDRWLVSCLGSLHLARGLLFRAAPADQTFSTPEYCGAFRFRVWWCGRWEEVVVDDRLPTLSGRLVFAHHTLSTQFWAPLLEKAYAKLHGSYEALKYGSALDGLSELTGGAAEAIDVRADPTVFGRLLPALLGRTSLLTCVVRPDEDESGNVAASGARLASGVLVGVAYRLEALEKLETRTGDHVTLVRLRCACGLDGAAYGAWSNGSLDWETQAAPGERTRLMPPPGSFWMSYQNFVRTFSHLEVSHLDEETAHGEPSLRNRRPWRSCLFRGCWRKGVSAGGCRQHLDSFHLNPQVRLQLQDSGETEVVAALQQHCAQEPKVIGFSIFRLEDGASMWEAQGRSFLRKAKAVATSAYANSRQVSARLVLPKGVFLMIPTTYEAGKEAGFTIRVMADSTAHLRLLDTTPKLLRPVILKAPLEAESGFAQYEAVFLQLADEQRSVSAFELQELLDACLPNDYIKSCATLEVCRQIVMALGSEGRLTFGAFKDLLCSLKNWQAAFKSQSKEKTGVLRAERLRDALQQVGFQLSSEVLSLLLLRHMRKDGTLRFGDFVAAVLHLGAAFGAFDSGVKEGDTSVFTLSEWLRAALTC